MILVAASLLAGIGAIMWKPYLSLTVLLIHGFVLNWFALKFYPVSYSLFGSVGTVLLYFPIILLYIKGNRIIREFSHVYIVFIFVFSLWLYLLSLYHNVSWMKYLLFFRNYFHFFLIFPLTIYTIKRKNHYWIIYPIMGVILFQIVLFLIQMGIPSFQNYLIVEYRQTTNGWVALVSETLLRGKTFVGTFIRPANIGNFLAIIIPSLIVLKHLKFFRIKKFIYLILLLLLIGIILYTGIRTSFITFTIMTAGVLFILNKKTFSFFSVFALVFFVLVMPAIQNLSSQYDRSESFENPISRVSNLFETSNKKALTEETTVRRTANILDQYESFIWGSGRHLKGSYYEGISSITDATLAVNLIEFGIITFILSIFLFFYPLKKIYKSSSRAFNLSLVFLIGVLLQTITDQGVFTLYSSIPLFIIFGILYTYNIKELKHE